MRVPYRRLRLIESALADGRRSWVDCATPLERALCRGLSNEERTELAEALLEAERERYHRPAETAAREAFASLFAAILEKVAERGEQAVCELVADTDPAGAARRWLESSSAEERVQLADHLYFGHPLEPGWWVTQLASLASDQEIERARQAMHETGALEPVARALEGVWRKRADFTRYCPWRSVRALLEAALEAV